MFLTILYVGVSSKYEAISHFRNKRPRRYEAKEPCTEWLSRQKWRMDSQNNPNRGLPV